MLWVIQKPWFFADIEREEAESNLRDAGLKKGFVDFFKLTFLGSFLVRCNLGGTVSPQSAPFTISCVVKGSRIVHHRVYRVAEVNCN